MVKKAQKTLFASVLAAGLVAGVVGCGTTSGASNTSSGNATSKTSSSQSTKKFVIGLSNSYFGNSTRVEMEKIVEAQAKLGPNANQISKLVITNSGNDVAAQIQAIDNMIAEHVNAILLDAASPTGLNNVIAQAHAHGIVVVGYDNVTTSPYVINVSEPMQQYAAEGMTWLAQTIHGKGNIVILRGVAGTYDDTLEAKGIQSVLQKYPNIHVLNTSYANWDEATAQTDMSNLLHTYSNIDGVYTEGGEQQGVLEAYVNAHKPFVPSVGGSLNGTLKLWAKYKNQGLTAWAVSPDVWQSALALNVAMDVLNGKKEPKNVTAPLVTFTTSDFSKYYDPSLPDALFLNVSDPAVGINLTPQQVLSQKTP